MTISGGVMGVRGEETLQNVEIKPRNRFKIPLGFTSEPTFTSLKPPSLPVFLIFTFYKNKEPSKRL